MTELEETMKIRKAVQPLIKELVERDEAIKEVSREIAESFNTSVDKIEKIIAQLLEKDTSTVKIANPQKEVTLAKAVKLDGPIQVKDNLTKSDLAHLSKDLTKIVKEQSNVTEKLIEKSIRSTEKNIGNLVEAVSKLILKSIPEQKEYTQQSPMPVQVTNQYLAGGTSAASNTDDRVWLREQYTYTTVSGNNFAVSRVVKWNHAYKLTEDYQYDANGNPIVRSRSLEPSTQIGA